MKYVLAVLAFAALAGCYTDPNYKGPKYVEPCDQYESHVDQNLCNMHYQKG